MGNGATLRTGSLRPENQSCEKTNTAVSQKCLHILIVTTAFPPLNSIASHRPYSWAKVWKDEGHTVHVLTLKKYSYEGPADLTPDMTDIHVHEIPYLGSSGAPQNRGSALAPQWEWLKRVTRRIRLALGMFGDVRVLAYPSMVREGVRIAREHDIDLIVATTPPELVLLVARTIASKLSIPWAADFRDAWFPDLRLYHTNLVGGIAGPITKWLVRSAMTCVTVSHGLRKRLSSYLGREVFLAYNGYFMGVHGESTARPWNDQKLHIAYTGRVYPGKQNPEPLFRVLASLRRTQPDVADRLSVDFYGLDGPWLQPMIKRYGVEDCVHAHGFVPYQESINVQRAADVLLFLDWVDDRGDGMLTGKLLEYMGSGRPILALGSRKETEAARLITDTGCGVTMTDEEQLFAYLTRVLVTGRPAETCSPLREEFSRERQARALLQHLRSRLCLHFL